MHALVGKLLGIDLKEGTPLGEMLARMLGLALEMELGEEKGTLDLEMNSRSRNGAGRYAATSASLTDALGA